MLFDTTKIDTLVLAGGINRITLYEGYKPGYKGLLPFRGKPLIQYTLDALNATQEVGKICLVGPTREIAASIAEPHQYEYIEAGRTLIENIAMGLDHFRTSGVILVIPADLPLVRSSTISEFLTECTIARQARPYFIFWSVVREDRFVEAYRTVKKGFNRFRNISICHGNLLLLSTSLLRNRQFMSRMNGIYNARKSSIRAALAVGPSVGISYLLGVHLLRMLTLAQFARIVSSGFDVDLIPVVMEDPGIAIDVDEARDYRFIMKELDRREHPENSDKRSVSLRVA